MTHKVKDDASIRKNVRNTQFEYVLSDKEPSIFARDKGKTGVLYAVIKGKRELVEDDLKPSELDIDKAIDVYLTEQDKIAAKNKAKKEEKSKIFDEFKTKGWS